MKVMGRWYRTIWPVEDGRSVEIIDQTLLPHTFDVIRLGTLDEVAEAIRAMRVRGAPLIGAAAAYGVMIEMASDPTDSGLERAIAILSATRPTAVNLRWALDRMADQLQPSPADQRFAAARDLAEEIADRDVETCRRIGANGLGLIRKLSSQCRGRPLNVLTHCNAGWLATVDWGTALAPVYQAHDAGIGIHVWVDETRPRNQGFALTAFELAAHGVPHTLITDNAGGHLMQRGQIDLCIVGSDRTAANGDVANKIGTYLKALAARDNGVPFYVALPSTTIDWTISDGLSAIPIEERGSDEVTSVRGRTDNGEDALVAIAPAGCTAFNPAFDVTPAHLVTSLITERGICEASHSSLARLFPDRTP